MKNNTTQFQTFFKESRNHKNLLNQKNTETFLIINEFKYIFLKMIFILELWELLLVYSEIIKRPSQSTIKNRTIHLQFPRNRSIDIPLWWRNQRDGCKTNVDISANCRSKKRKLAENSLTIDIYRPPRATLESRSCITQLGGRGSNVRVWIGFPRNPSRWKLSLRGIERTNHFERSCVNPLWYLSSPILPPPFCSQELKIYKR